MGCGSKQNRNEIVKIETMKEIESVGVKKKKKKKRIKSNKVNEK